MVEWRSEDDSGAGEQPAVIIRRRPGLRIARLVALALLILLLIAAAGLWIARRPIASNVLEREFERRGVDATYDLERVGFRTQVIRNLVIGDPKDPDLTARYAQIQLRIKLDGTIEVYRIVARGVRLEGKVIRNRVIWGQLSKLLPPPSDKPFAFPNIVVDIADSSISLQAPFGPLGFAVQGSGNLSGGFKGALAASSPRLIPGRCQLTNLRAVTAIEIIARRPHIEGPVQAERFACSASNIVIDKPRFDIDSRFSESFTSFDGRGRVAIERLVAGENGLAAAIGNVSFKGTPEAVRGRIQMAAQRSRLGPIYAERTRINGGYLIGAAQGTMAMVGQYAAEDATLTPGMLAGITDPLAALVKTPLGPIGTAISNAIRRAARSFDASGDIRVVNFPGGGAARIETASVRTDSGGRARVSGGDGVTYYWPTGRLRVDGLIQMAGGGLPTGSIALRQPRGGGPFSGIANIYPYSVGASRLALEPIRFQVGAGGATEFSTVAQLDGPFPDGRVAALRLPLAGTIGNNGSLALGRQCIVASFSYFRMRALQLGPTRLPICPIGPAILTQAPGRSLDVDASINQPLLAGRLGNTPLNLSAASARIVDGKEFAASDFALRMGKSQSPIVFDAARLQGTFRGSGINGTFAGAESIIGNVPLLMSNADGRWRFYKGDLLVDGAMTVTDRSQNPRFYPLRSNDFSFKLGGDNIRAGGSLLHPGSGTKVADVTIGHRLSTGAGQALIDVPGIRFGAGLQPEELTRLTEGVVALVQGTVTGRGEINWSGEGKVTSTGEFSTAGMDLAAPFGPVTGLTTTVRFTDLLGLETAPGQSATIASINPGILVENGVLTYQLLPNQRVRVQRGEWPFMGGRLVLQETILDFSRPTAKRLTFQVVGFDAKQFVDTFGFEGLEITGIFDGVLPMIFDESGGRIVGGRLDSRAPGGQFAYNGTKPDAGLMVGVAFDLLSNIRYRSMIIRLDGDLAGEFATRFTINEVSLGNRGGFAAGLVRGAFRKVPLRVNLSIRGPFRALIQMAKGFKDPTAVIQPVLPFPLDAPGLSVETRVLRKEEDQQRITPIDDVDVSTQRQPEE